MMSVANWDCVNGASVTSDDSQTSRNPPASAVMYTR